ncbi:MAG: hypothetical protein HDT23_01575 [Ruminococcus sp.]|nr:hypothetical protein [Ruminococcus sp.]
MRELSFKYCPICNGELEIGKIESRSRSGVYYSDKITEEIKVHPVKKFLRKPDKTFIVGYKAGYCQRCGRIFPECYVRGEYNLIDG